MAHNAAGDLPRPVRRLPLPHSHSAYCAPGQGAPAPLPSHLSNRVCQPCLY